MSLFTADFEALLNSYHSGDYAGALDAAERLREFGNISPRCCFYRAALLAELGRLNEAEVWFRRSLRLDKRGNKRSLAITLTSLGYALLHAGRSREAERHFRKSISLDPSRSSPYCGMALLCLVRGADAREAMDWAGLALQRQAEDRRSASELRKLSLGECLGTLAWATAADSHIAERVRRLVAQALKAAGTGTVEVTARVNYHAGCAYRELGNMRASTEYWKEAARVDAQGAWGRAARNALRDGEKSPASRPALLGRERAKTQVSRGGLAPRPDEVEGQVAERLQRYRRPSLRLITGRRSAQAVSRLGGRPNLPKDIRWPVREGQPLSFVAQFDLGGLPKLRNLSLPKSGSLFFFYDAENLPWGFDPKDRGGARVIYSRSPLAESPLRALPGDLDGDARFRAIALTATPHVEPGDLPETPLHRIGGCPDEIQGDVFLTAQLASNGVYCGDGRAYEKGRKMGLSAGADNWRLLLQVDSDSRTGMNWGESGRIYFLIRADDLRHRDFDHVWLILQCT